MMRLARSIQASAALAALIVTFWLVALPDAAGVAPSDDPPTPSLMLSTEAAPAHTSPGLTATATIEPGPSSVASPPVSASGPPPAAEAPSVPALEDVTLSIYTVLRGYDFDSELAGMAFAVSVVGGTPGESTVTTDDTGNAALAIHPAGRAATVSIVPVPREPYWLVGSYCWEVGHDADRAPGALAVTAGGSYGCSFQFGDPAGSSSELWLNAWRYGGPDEPAELSFTAHLTVTRGTIDTGTIAFVVGDEERSAQVMVNPGQETALVKVTIDPIPGLRVTNAGCALRQEGEEVGGAGRFVRPALVVEVQPFSHYFCGFTFEPASRHDNTVDPTPPETDTE